MAFFLWIQAEAKTAEYRDEFLKGLKGAAAASSEHTGAISYQTFRPDPDNRPNYIWILELYGNETTFNHHIKPALFEAIGDSSNQDRFSSWGGSTYAERPGVVTPTVQKHLTLFGLKEGQDHLTLAKGYTRRKDATFTTYTDALLMLWKFTTSQSAKVVEHLEQLIAATNSDVVACGVIVHNEDVRVFEIVSSNEGLLKHLADSRSKRCLEDVRPLCTNIDMRVFGNVKESSKETLLGFSKDIYLFPKKDSGWIVHKAADFVGN